MSHTLSHPSTPTSRMAAPAALPSTAVATRQLDAAALLLRAALGAMWISHGLLKLLVFTPAGTAAFFAGVGLPGALALPVIAAELLGGLVILAGWHGRVVSVLLLPILAGAALVHLPNGWVFTANGGGWEYPLFLIAMSIVHALLGDGAWRFVSRRTGAVN